MSEPGRTKKGTLALFPRQFSVGKMAHSRASQRGRRGLWREKKDWSAQRFEERHFNGRPIQDREENNKQSPEMEELELIAEICSTEMGKKGNGEQWQLRRRERTEERKSNIWVGGVGETEERERERENINCFLLLHFFNYFSGVFIIFFSVRIFIYFYNIKNEIMVSKIILMKIKI